MLCEQRGLRGLSIIHIIIIITVVVIIYFFFSSAREPSSRVFSEARPLDIQCEQRA
jgi:uncharacterized membrane protein